MDRCPPALEADQRFGRRTDHGQAVEVEQVHVREGLVRRNAVYSSAGVLDVANSNRCESTTWKMSPSRMRSFGLLDGRSELRGGPIGAKFR